MVHGQCDFCGQEADLEQIRCIVCGRDYLVCKECETDICQECESGEVEEIVNGTESEV